MKSAWKIFVVYRSMTSCRQLFFCPRLIAWSYARLRFGLYMSDFVLCPYSVYDRLRNPPWLGERAIATVVRVDEMA